MGASLNRCRFFLYPKARIQCIEPRRTRRSTPARAVARDGQGSQHDGGWVRRAPKIPRLPLAAGATFGQANPIRFTSAFWRLNGGRCRNCGGWAFGGSRHSLPGRQASVFSSELASGWLKYYTNSGMRPLSITRTLGYACCRQMYIPYSGINEPPACISLRKVAGSKSLAAIPCFNIRAAATPAASPV